MKKKVILKGKLKLYMMWPILLGLILLPAVVVTYFFSTMAGYIVTAAFSVYIIIAVILYCGLRKKVLRSMVNFAMNYDDMQKRLLDELEIPYGLVDEQGKFLWMNLNMKEILHSSVGMGNNIDSYFAKARKQIFESVERKAEFEVDNNDKSYKVLFERLDINGLVGIENLLGEAGADVELAAVYLLDQTLLKKYEKENHEQKLVAGLIYIDNYEEAMDSVESVRRSLLEALIDRKITKYISAMDGIVRKIEKDKYFIVMKRKYVEMLQNERFTLLNEVKTVNIGNDIAVTLSIGMGISDDKYSVACEYARAAIDLALGRGGDQAVVKQGEDIFYFGGKSKQMEKYTKVKARVKAQALRELFENNDKVIIMGHKIGDSDSLGAAVGIYRVAKAKGKKTHIVLKEITTSMRPEIEAFMNDENYEKDMFLNPEEAKGALDDSTVVVVVDVNIPSRTECPELLGMCKNVVVIDHHRQKSGFIENPVLSYIETYASSASELVTELLQYIGDGVKLRPVEADAMYAGIVVDTNNFMDMTGVRTFEAAAFLRRNGADVTRVRKMLRGRVEEYQAKAEIIHNAEIFENSFIISTYSGTGVESPTIVAAKAANELLNIDGIRASFVLSVFNDVVYISARSLDNEVNVQLIMERLGGGGHMTVAGAQLSDVSLEEGEVRLKEIIKTMITEGDL